jgi:predicted transporter
MTLLGIYFVEMGMILPMSTKSRRKKETWKDEHTLNIF